MISEMRIITNKILKELFLIAHNYVKIIINFRYLLHSINNDRSNLYSYDFKEIMKKKYQKYYSLNFDFLWSEYILALTCLWADTYKRIFAFWMLISIILKGIFLWVQALINELRPKIETSRIYRLLLYSAIRYYGTFCWRNMSNRCWLQFLR